MRIQKALFLPLLVALTASTLPAQLSSAGSVANPGSANGNPRTGIPSPATQPGNPGVENSMPVFISGKVATSDGSELPQNIGIVRICSNVRRTIGYTDGKGRFNIRISGGGPDIGVLGDASEPGRAAGPNSGGFGGGTSSQSRAMIGQRSSATPLLGCDLQASAPGFTSPTIDLGSRHNMDDPDIGTIILHRIAGIEGTSVSATSYSAPKDAQKAFQKGEQLLQKDKPDLALKEFEKATGLYPKYAAAWLDLGRTQERLKDDTAASDSFRKAIDADPKLVDSWSELGMVDLRRKNWAEAAQNLDHALRLNSVEFPTLWFYDAVANFNSQHFDVAEKSAREAQRVDPRHENPQADQILGLILYQKKDFPGALEALRSYLKYAHEPPDTAQVQTQIAELEKALAAR